MFYIDSQSLQLRSSEMPGSGGEGYSRVQTGGVEVASVLQQSVPISFEDSEKSHNKCGRITYGNMLMSNEFLSGMPKS